MELNAVSIDGEVPADLDESGIERVPMADPGLDVRVYNMQVWNTYLQAISARVPSGGERPFTCFTRSSCPEEECLAR